MELSERLASAVKWDADGLCVAVVQDRLTGRVQMVAWMNAESLSATLRTKRATFWSRSRRSLWVKGETSGHVLLVDQISVDCDADTLLLLVDPIGPSCHTGAETCFFRAIDALGDAVEATIAAPLLLQLGDEIERRKASDGERSYTRSLLDGGAAKIGEKLREEAGELAIAIASESNERVASEAADVVYHLLVGLALREIPWRQVLAALAARRARSGHAEKAARDENRGKLR